MTTSGPKLDRQTRAEIKWMVLNTDIKRDEVRDIYGVSHQIQPMVKANRLYKAITPKAPNWYKGEPLPLNMDVVFSPGAPFGEGPTNPDWYKKYVGGV